MIINKRLTLLAALALAGCAAAICVSKASADAPGKAANTAYYAIGDTNQVPPTPLNSSTTEALRTLTISIILLAVIGTAVIYVSKKWLPKIGVSKSRHISVLESVQLAPNRRVHLIEVGSQRFIVGSSNESVRMLADVTLALTDMSGNKDGANEQSK
jgi:flagellar biogenesis protein FliO